MTGTISQSTSSQANVGLNAGVGSPRFRQRTFSSLAKSAIASYRHRESAAIAPFAQRDKADRVTFGIDEAFEDPITKIVEEAAAGILEQTVDNIDKTAKEYIMKVVMERCVDTIKNQKELAAADLRAVVNHLSKKELGEIAYSLAELTSKKRRYSSEQETVGGPIDVAILTRNEGLIWVRRKQYFDTVFNPAYLERLKQAITRTGDFNER